MRTGNLITLTAAVCFTVSQVAAVQAADWFQFPLHPSKDAQQAPDICGSVVVWQQFVDTDFDIYGADITDLYKPFVFIITDDIDDQLAPSIYEDTVVWQNYVETDWDIWAADINDQTAPQSFAVSE